MKLFNSQRASTVLGISLDGNRLEAVVVRRTGDAVQVRQTVSAPLALSPLTGDPELVGREIRNHLDSAGIRERACAVCLPLTWVLTLQTKVPELSAADTAGFLQLEAERGFPSGYESLFITNSRFKAPSGDHYATLLAVPRNHLDLLQRALRAAKLKPVAFAMGISAAQSPSQNPARRVLALALSGHGLELQISGGGGVLALRSLDAAVESEGARRQIASDLVAREIRITLGQLPGGFADGPGPVRIFGEGAMAHQFITEVSPRLDALGLTVEALEPSAGLTFANAPVPEIAGSPVLALAAAYVRNGDVGPDFLPPKVAPWRQFVTTKLGTQKLAYAGGAVAVVAFCLGVAFGWQQIQIMRLNSQWNAISAKSSELEDDQAHIQKYRPWFDDSYRSLAIWKGLDDAFPDMGWMTAKTFEIHDLTNVMCSGTAQNREVFNTMREKLGKIPGVTKLHSETRGDQPTQYTLNYEWHPEEEGGTSSGN